MSQSDYISDTAGVELWDLYDHKGFSTRQTMRRGQRVPQGLYHLVVHIWVMDSNGRYLIQQRSQNVSWKPGQWASTGGSAIAGEDPLNAAIRELGEEVGLHVCAADMCLVNRMRRTNSFCYIYRVLSDLPESAFTLQKEEVAAVKWVTQAQIEQMIAQGEFHDYGDMYFQGIWERIGNPVK